MFSNQFYFLFDIIILIPILCSTQTISNRFCDRGQLDSAVRTNSGRIFVFIDSYLIEFNERLEIIPNSNPITIHNVFRGQNFDRIDAAFTADGHNNPNRNKTYLIRREIIQEYSDEIVYMKPTGNQATIQNWKISGAILSNITLVINQLEDKNAIFITHKEYNEQGHIKNYWVGYVLLFTSISKPDEMSPNQLNISLLFDKPQDLPTNKLLLKAVIGLSNKSYLLFYNPIDAIGTGKYCWTQILVNGCSQYFESKDLCNNKPNSRSTSPPTIRTTSRPTKRPTPPPIPTTVSTNENIETTSNRFCDQGKLDSAVRTNDSRIFVFFGSYLIELNDKLEIHNLSPIPIRDVFRGLDFNRIDAAFTTDGHNNPIAGNTYLIRGKEIKEFKNITSTGRKANMNTWQSKVNLSSVNLVINQIGDSMALFFHITEHFNIQNDSVMLLFDSLSDPSELYRPGYVRTSRLIVDQINGGLLLKAVIVLSNNSYLVLYNPIDRKANGKYCIIESLNHGCTNRLFDTKNLCKGVTSGTSPSNGSDSESENDSKGSVLLIVFIVLIILSMIIAGICILFAVWQRNKNLKYRHKVSDK